MAGSGPDWEALQRGLSGLVALPGSAAFELARPPFIAGIDELQPLPGFREGRGFVIANAR